MKRPIHSRAVGWAFTGACLVIAWVGLGTYLSTHRLVLSFDSVSESHQAIEKLQSIQELIQAGQSSAYNYVITGREERLDIYRRSNVQITRKLREVRSLVRGHPKQMKALWQFHGVLAVHQRYLAQIIKARQNDGFEAASRWVASEDDHSVREVMSLLLDDIQKEQNTVLKSRSANTSAHSLHTQIALAGAAAVSLLLIIWAFGLLRRESGHRQIAESTQLRLEACLRSILERIPYMVLVRDAETLRLTLVNKAATEWLGRSEEELLGANDYDLLPHEDARIAIEQDREALRKGEPVDIPEDFLAREGLEGRILHTQKVAIPDETGAPAFLLTISEDISRRKAEERLLKQSRDTAIQSEQLKAEFIRNMSHEIRTPLSIVVGMISLLLDTELAPEQRSFAGKIESAAGGLARLTKSILDFSKIESGMFTVEMQEMNLRHTIEGILTMLTEQAKTKGVGLVCLVPPSVPQTLVGDPNRLRQVLTELITNALKFSTRGEIIVRVKEARQTEAQLWLTIEVSDTGPGIDKEVQKHLFEPFRQGDGSFTRRFGGTGLGLAISKRIVELMGGQIGFSSAPKEGSTFWCTLPFTRRSASPTLPIQIAALPWTHARVLVVDENSISRQQMRDHLSAWSLTTEGVSSGAAAIDMLRREQAAGRPFQIVLFDIQLVDMEGAAFSRAVKSDASIADTRLVVLTETPIDPSTAYQLGFSAWVPKPVQPQTLLDRLAGLADSNNPARRSAA